MPRVNRRIVCGLVGVLAVPLVAHAQARNDSTLFSAGAFAPEMRLRPERFRIGLGVGAHGIDADSLRALAAAESGAPILDIRRALALRRALAGDTTPHVEASDTSMLVACPMPVAVGVRSATAEMPVWRADSLVERRSSATAQVRACANALGVPPAR